MSITTLLGASRLQETSLAAISRLRRRNLMEVRSLNDRVGDVQRCQNCLSNGPTRFLLIAYKMPH